MSNAQPVVDLPGGVAMPLLGFGTWQASGDDCYQAVKLALDAGYRHIDTATMYGNEQQVGRALRDSVVPTDQVFVTTKLPAERAGRERQTIEASLSALGVDAVDLWLVHWPPARGKLVDVWRALIAIRDEGLTRTIGVSNYSIGQIDELIEATGEKPAVNQIRWGPSLYDPVVQAEHRERGVVLEGYSPFKTTKLSTPALVQIAKEHGVTPAQVVLRWHLQHETVVIPKSITPERIRQNADIFGFELTDDQMRQVDAMAGGH
jgi:diketogulonate reductase-like aldo/keto reductase